MKANRLLELLGDPQRNLSFRLNHPECFENGRVNLDRVLELMAKSPSLAATAKSFPWEFAPAQKVVESPAFHVRLKRETGVALAPLIKGLKARIPGFTFESFERAMQDRLYEKTESGDRDRWVKIVEVEREFRDRIGLELWDQMIEVWTFKERYHELLLKDLENGSQFWDAAAGLPHKDKYVFREIPDFEWIRPGTIILMGTEIVTVLNKIGTGGEHHVYDVKRDDGRISVLKIGGFAFYDKKQEWKEIRDHERLEVLDMEFAAPGFVFVERFRRNGHSILKEYLESEGARGASEVAELLEFYRSYRHDRSDFFVADLKADNIAYVDGRWKVSDWLVAGPQHKLDGKWKQRHAREYELSSQFHKSFAELFSERFKGKKEASSEDMRVLTLMRDTLERFINELDLGRFSKREEVNALFFLQAPPATGFLEYLNGIVAEGREAFSQKLRKSYERRHGSAEAEAAE